MTSTLNFYSVASSAARGAKRANVATPIIFRMTNGDNSGKFSYVDADAITDADLLALVHGTDLLTVAKTYVENAQGRVVAAEEAERAKNEAAAKPLPLKPVSSTANLAASLLGLPKPGEVVIPVSTRSSYKELARRSPPKSTVENPVDIVWAFVAENPDMPRKQAITALVNLGINLATVKTQYQKAKSGKARFKAKETK